jgi:hypothetical protein
VLNLIETHLELVEQDLKGEQLGIRFGYLCPIDPESWRNDHERNHDQSSAE